MKRVFFSFLIAGLLITNICNGVDLGVAYISVETAPLKRFFALGQQPDLTGGILKLVYFDEREDERIDMTAAGVTVSPQIFETVGDNVRVRVNYGTQWTEFDVVVLDKFPEGLTLTFSDEMFGCEIDLRKWAHQSGTGGLDPVTGINYGLTRWGNAERQYYQAKNTTLSDGIMRINGKREPNPAGTVETEFTASRIRTAGLFAQRYGRFEARIKVPAVAGYWPAFWLMPEPPPDSTHPTNGVYGGWPISGEIDIMEARGSIPDRVGQAIHFGIGTDTLPTHRYIHRVPDYIFPNEGRIDEFHVYGVDWFEDRIEFAVNGAIVFTINASQWMSNQWTGVTNHAQREANAPFDKPFHMIINLAIGGNFARGVLPPPEFEEAAMEIDWVRVWQFDEYL